MLVFLCTCRCTNLPYKITTYCCKSINIIFELLVTFRSIQEIFYICVIQYIWKKKRHKYSSLLLLAVVPVVDLERAQLFICIHWYFVMCAYNFYLLVHRYNQELRHQQIARVRDVVVFETRILSSVLP